MNINIGTIASIILLIIIIGYFGIKYYRNREDNEYSKKLKEVFNNIKDIIEEAMIEYIKNTDITNLNNINDMQKEVLENMYDKVWDLVILKITEMYVSNEELGNTIKTIITRKKIEDFVNQIYEQSKPIQEQVTLKYNQAVLSAHE